MKGVGTWPVWLIRHAPVIAPPGLCYGHSDYPAEAEATQAAAQQAALMLPQGCRLFSSPLQRCTALAQALLALRPDLQPLQIEPRLAEMNFGQWEGVAWDAIPRAAFDAWMADFGAHRFGGAESSDAFVSRVAAFVAEQSGRHPQTALACVCHAGTIRALHYLQGKDWHNPPRLQSAQQWPAQDIALGSCQYVLL